MVISSHIFTPSNCTQPRSNVELQHRPATVIWPSIIVANYWSIDLVSISKSVRSCLNADVCLFFENIDRGGLSVMPIDKNYKFSLGNTNRFLRAFATFDHRFCLLYWTSLVCFLVTTAPAERLLDFSEPVSSSPPLSSHVKYKIFHQSSYTQLASGLCKLFSIIIIVANAVESIQSCTQRTFLRVTLKSEFSSIPSVNSDQSDFYFMSFYFSLTLKSLRRTTLYSEQPFLIPLARWKDSRCRQNFAPYGWPCLLPRVPWPILRFFRRKVVSFRCRTKSINTFVSAISLKASMTEVLCWISNLNKIEP